LISLTTNYNCEFILKLTCCCCFRYRCA